MEGMPTMFEIWYFSITFLAEKSFFVIFDFPKRNFNTWVGKMKFNHSRPWKRAFVQQYYGYNSKGFVEFGNH